MRRWDEGRRKNGVCAPLHGKDEAFVAPARGRWVVASSPLLRLRGLATQAGFYGHGVPALSRCAHADDAASSGRCLSLDRRGRVIAVHRLVLPGARLRCGRAWAVVERTARRGPVCRRRCVPAPRCSATQKAEGARSSQELRPLRQRRTAEDKNKPREGDIDEKFAQFARAPCSMTWDTLARCLRFPADPALEAARSAKAVPWPVDGGEGECAASRGGEGGSAAHTAQEMSVPGWRLRVRSEGLQPRGSLLTIEIEPV